MYVCNSLHNGLFVRHHPPALRFFHGKYRISINHLPLSNKKLKIAIFLFFEKGKE